MTTMSRDQIIASNPLIPWLEARSVKIAANGKRAARCPLKEHTRQDTVSLDGAQHLWHCHACNVGGTVIDWLALEKGISATEAMREFGGSGSKATPATSRREVCAYDYRDEKGAMLFQVVRFEPKDFRQRRPDGNGEWNWNLDGVRRVLFRLPETLRAVQSSLPVFVCEGEKDVLAMVEHNFAATCNPGGAGKWRDEYSETLRGAPVVVIADKDKRGRDHAAQVASSLHGMEKSIRVVELPDTNGQPVKDAADYFAAGGTADELLALAEAAPEWMPDTKTTAKYSAPIVEFLRPSELINYRPPEGIVLVGDCHIVRGNVFVIGGPPGIGKSRSGVALAVAGATGADWFGLKVPARFRTMIVQNENGRFRLSREFADLDCAALEDFVRVCPPPPLGLAFDRAEFQETLAAAIAAFRPDVIVIDPWNAVARDEKARDYLDTFNAIRAVIPAGDTAPALGIVAHTRKPKTDERATGRGLLNLLAGSYVLGSVPRSVFVMQSASDDPTDNRVVWTCCKNNDGELGPRSAWERRNGLFASVADFDWMEFDRPASERPMVTEADVAGLFEHGKRSIRRAEAIDELMERTHVGKTACYNALNLKGRFGRHLKEVEGLLTWTP